eukprot:Clim_evm45s55 gene=Clim_evmTU45s55
MVSVDQPRPSSQEDVRAAGKSLSEQANCTDDTGEQAVRLVNKLTDERKSLIETVKQYEAKLNHLTKEHAILRRTCANLDRENARLRTTQATDLTQNPTQQHHHARSEMKAGEDTEGRARTDYISCRDVAHTYLHVLKLRDILIDIIKNGIRDETMGLLDHTSPCASLSSSVGDKDRNASQGGDTRDSSMSRKYQQALHRANLLQCIVNSNKGLLEYLFAENEDLKHGHKPQECSAQYGSSILTAGDICSREFFKELVASGILSNARTVVSIQSPAKRPFEAVPQDDGPKETREPKRLRLERTLSGLVYHEFLNGASRLSDREKERARELGLVAFCPEVHRLEYDVVIVDDVETEIGRVHLIKMLLQGKVVIHRRDLFNERIGQCCKQYAPHVLTKYRYVLLGATDPIIDVFRDLGKTMSWVNPALEDEMPSVSSIHGIIIIASESHFKVKRYKEAATQVHKRAENPNGGRPRVAFVSERFFVGKVLDNSDEFMRSRPEA